MGVNVHNLKFQVPTKNEELKVPQELCDSEKVGCKRAEEECMQAKPTKQKVEKELLLAKKEMAR